MYQSYKYKYCFITTLEDCKFKAFFAKVKYSFPVRAGRSLLISVAAREDILQGCSLLEPAVKLQPVQLQTSVHLLCFHASHSYFHSIAFAILVK